MANTTDDEVRALLDKQQIAECLTRLARGIDRHDDELARSSYHDDARDDHTIFIGSGAGLVDWANGYHDANLRMHQHLLTNMYIDLDGDEAHVETYVTFAAIEKERLTLSLGGGRYNDRLERRNGRWAITDRVLTMEWWNDPDTLRFLDRLTHPYSHDRSDLSYTRPLRVVRADFVDASADEVLQGPATPVAHDSQ
jgi:hypothetical protein